MNRMIRLPLLLGTLILAAATAPAQEVTTRTIDSTLTQKWTSDFGYSFQLPARAKFNTIGSGVNQSGRTQTANFILPGGSGSIKIQNFAEGQMVPKGYKVTEDSVHYYQIDSAGTNGTIHRRNYILRDIVVIMEVLLTPKGQNEYGAQLQAIFDSFVPPPGADKTLQDWRFGRVMKKE
jgi:hypothetical protein